MDGSRLVAVGLLAVGFVGPAVTYGSMNATFDPFRSWGWLGAAIGVSTSGRRVPSYVSWWSRRSTSAGGATRR
jgi:hypothetical protein